MSNKQDYLDEDPVITSQRYAIISFSKDDGPVKFNENKTDTAENNHTKTGIVGVKVKYVCESYEEATEKAKYFRDMDPRFDTYIGEVGKWLPINPDNEKDVKDVNYAESELQNIMKTYLENKDKLQIFESKRKITNKLEIANDNLKIKQKNRKKMVKGGGDYSAALEKLDKDIKKLEKDSKELSKQEKEYMEQLGESKKVVNDKPETISE
jgi:chromosome segregation ATPase